MLLTGIISILQLTLLPGLLIINILNIKTVSPIQKWLYVFSFSLYANYVVVTLLVLFSIYYTITAWVVVIAEAGYLSFIYRKKIRGLGNRLFLTGSVSWLRSIIKNNKGMRGVLLSAVLLVVLFYISVLLANIGTVFYFVDTVNNYEWNKWAIDFYNNIFPRFASHFPQLLPANWSLCYVLTGYPDVHFFPKAIMPLFALGIISMFLDLAFVRNNTRYLTGLVLYGVLAPIVFSLVFVADGNADLPVSFFSFLTFYSFAVSPTGNSDILADKRFVLSEFVYPFAGQAGYNNLITFLFATMAAATKLAGFYTFTVAFILLVLIFITNKNLHRSGILIKVVLFVAAACCISLFWYIKSPDVMYSGLHQPEYVAINHWDTFTNAIVLMYYNWGAPVFAFLTITIIASLFHKRIRYISIIMVTIPLFLWMIKYSMDFRNLSFVIPYMCLCSAAGLYKLAEFIVPGGKPVNHYISSISETDGSFKVIQKPGSRYFKLTMLLLSGTGVLLFFIFINDYFYAALLSVYEFINKYYFRSNRIVYFVDFSIMLHAEFYQRVFAAFALLIAIVPLVIISGVKIKQLFLVIVVSIVFLNFTYITKEEIINHQRYSYDKVDAHNYYELVNTILKGKNVSKIILTNFKVITESKLAGDILFIYHNNIENMLDKKLNRETVFIKTNIKGKNISSEISKVVNEKGYKVLLKDNDYILFITE